MLMVSHQTSYSICIAVTNPARIITDMVDHNCVAYTNTVEIIFTQQIQLHTVKSFNVMPALLQQDIQTKLQTPALHN